MNKKMEILFILVILVGTSTDFIIRQLVPNQGFLLNIICLSMACMAVYLFYKVTSSKNLVTENISNRQNKIATSGLTPMQSLLHANDPLLIVRFFAAFIVFVTHMSILLQPKQNLLIGHWGNVLTGGAHAGMAIFFTLSGFLMGKAFLSGRYELSRQGIIVFYKSRWIRIFPLMFFVAFFLFVLEYPQVLRFDFFSITRLLTFNYYGNTIGLNGIGAMWSLSVEFQYYLIAPFVFSIFDAGVRKNKIKGIINIIATIILFTLISYASKKYIFHHKNVYDPNFFSLLGNLPFFITGFLFNYVPFSISEKMAKFITNGWTLLIGMILFFLICNNHGQTIKYFLTISILSGLIISILDGTKHTDIYLVTIKKISLLKILQILGVLSYGFYLWHSEIGYVYSHLFLNGFTNYSSYLIEVSIIAIMVLSMSLITFILVEDRFNAYKPINKQRRDSHLDTVSSDVIVAERIASSA